MDYYYMGQPSMVVRVFTCSSFRYFDCYYICRIAYHLIKKSLQLPSINKIAKYRESIDFILMLQVGRNDIILQWLSKTAS